MTLWKKLCWMWHKSDTETTHRRRGCNLLSAQLSTYNHGWVVFPFRQLRLSPSKSLRTESNRTKPRLSHSYPAVNLLAPSESPSTNTQTHLKTYNQLCEWWLTTSIIIARRLALMNQTQWEIWATRMAKPSQVISITTHT